MNWKREALGVVLFFGWMAVATIVGTELVVPAVQSYLDALGVPGIITFFVALGLYVGIFASCFLGAPLMDAVTGNPVSVSRYWPPSDRSTKKPRGSYSTQAQPVSRPVVKLPERPIRSPPIDMPPGTVTLTLISSQGTREHVSMEGSAAISAIAGYLRHEHRIDPNRRVVLNGVGQGNQRVEIPAATLLTNLPSTQLWWSTKPADPLWWNIKRADKVTPVPADSVQPAGTEPSRAAATETAIEKLASDDWDDW